MKKIYVLLLATASSVAFAQIRNPDYQKICANSHHSSGDSSSQRVLGSNQGDRSSNLRKDIYCNQKQCLESGDCPHIESDEGEILISAFKVETRGCHELTKQENLTLYVLCATALNQNTTYELTDKNGDVNEMNIIELIFYPGLGWGIVRPTAPEVFCPVKPTQVTLTY